jgi:hypothetical protein
MCNNNKIRHLKRDPAYKKATETRDVFVEDDNFNFREALEVTIYKRKIYFEKTFQKQIWSPSDIDS